MTHLSRAAAAPVDGADEQQPIQPVGRLARLRREARAALASYRLRVVGGFIVLLALGSFGTVLVVGELQLRAIDATIQADLLQESEELRSLAGGTDPTTGEPFGTDVRRVFDVFFERNVPNRNEAFVAFVDGLIYRRSATVENYPLDLDPIFVQQVARATDTDIGQLNTPLGAVYYLALPVRAEGTTLGVFAIAAFRDVQRAEQGDILRATVLVGLVLLVIGSVLAWRLADRLLAPVLRTAATARTISVSDLTRRLEVRGHDEVAELARTLNEMLDRLEQAFEDQRRFLDDAGHELRTPLTIVRGHLELMDVGSAEDRDRTRELVLDELDRMARLVNDLIVLAQSARPDFLSREAVGAAELLASVHRKALVLGERNWILDKGRDGVLVCDRQRLTQALLQLAQNAVNHTGPGDEIHIGGDVDAHAVRLWVRDSGSGIAESEQAAIFERFYRGPGQSRATGQGLGLSIVRAIADAHGGYVDVASQPGSGAIMTIVLPR